MNYYKETEEKMQEQLYSNLQLLKMCYQTSKDFDKIFQKDMFAKNNKSAFHQVVHFLFEIIDPTLTSNMITSWPVYDPKMEAKFRTEVLNYINHIRLVHENAEIPPIMASHLIAPGGYKFLKFAFSLSQFALVQHLKREGIELLNDKPSPSTNITVNKCIIKNLKLNASNIESETCKLVEDFKKFQMESIRRADEIIEKTTKVHQDVLELQRDCVTTIPDDLESRLETCNVRIVGMRSLLCNMKQIQVSSQNCHDLVEQLIKPQLKFEYVANSLQVPEEIKSVTPSTSYDLDLCQLFKGVELLLQILPLSLPLHQSDSVKSTQKISTNFTRRYIELNSSFADLKRDLQNIKECFHQLSLMVN